MINFLIIGILAVINAMWAYIFVSSVIVHHNTPKLTNSGELGTLSTHINIKGNKSNAFFDRSRETKMPSVSIIVPARDEEHEIRRSLTSLLGQDYPDYEIIAIDDNSRDNTLDIMQSIKEEYLRNVKLESKTKLQQSFSEVMQSDASSLNVNDIGKTNEESLTLTVSYPSINSISTSSHDHENEKLKIISVKDRPKGWTAKTWASQQGFLHSKGEILIFTDADTYYANKGTIRAAISYLQNQDLDIITGFPFIELRDFWSKVIIPVWKLISNTFGTNATDINDPKSDAANLNGCFIVMGRKVFQDIGTYEAARNSIREDEALGIRAKKLGYKIRGMRMEDSLNALWSRDLSTLWWGIARTIIPIFLDKSRRTKVVSNMVILFLVGILPFIVLPYALNSSTGSYFDSTKSYFGIHSNQLKPTQYPFELSTQLFSLILPLDLSVCFMLFVGSAAFAKWEFKISTSYAIITPLAVIFLVVAYATHILSLKMTRRDERKTVEWRGRIYSFHDE